MKILVFDSDASVREVFSATLGGHDIVYIDGVVTMEALTANSDAEVVSFFVSSQFRKAEIDAFPKLRCIAARSTGVDHIDVEYAKQKGIEIKNVAKYGAHTVAEFTFALLLTLSRRTFDAFHQIREEGKFETMKLEGFDLWGKTIGVIGTGAIGRNVIHIARGFGMEVRLFDMHPDQTLSNEHVKYVSFEELLACADVITLHVPFTQENKHLINRDAIARMKKGVYLINTARGELIDTAALIDALNAGQIAGAGLDVLEEERLLKDEIELVKGAESIHTLKTLIQDHALIDMPRVIITPHIAFFSKEAYREILTISAQNIAALT